MNKARKFFSVTFALIGTIGIAGGGIAAGILLTQETNKTKKLPSDINITITNDAIKSIYDLLTKPLADGSLPSSENLNNELRTSTLENQIQSLIYPQTDNKNNNSIISSIFYMFDKKDENQPFTTYKIYINFEPYVNLTVPTNEYFVYNSKSKQLISTNPYTFSNVINIKNSVRIYNSIQYYLSTKKTLQDANDGVQSLVDDINVKLVKSKILTVGNKLLSISFSQAPSSNEISCKLTFNNEVVLGIDDNQYFQIDADGVSLTSIKNYTLGENPATPQ